MGVWLPFWIEEEQERDWKRVWVKMNLEPGKKYIVVVKKNGSHFPNGDAVFHFFDDFESDWHNKWDLTKRPAKVSQSGSYVVLHRNDNGIGKCGGIYAKDYSLPDTNFLVKLTGRSEGGEWPGIHLNVYADKTYYNYHHGSMSGISLSNSHNGELRRRGCDVKHLGIGMSLKKFISMEVSVDVEENNIKASILYQQSGNYKEIEASLCERPANSIEIAVYRNATITVDYIYVAKTLKDLEVNLIKNSDTIAYYKITSPTGGEVQIPLEVPFDVTKGEKLDVYIGYLYKFFFLKLSDNSLWKKDDTGWHYFKSLSDLEEEDFNEAMVAPFEVTKEEIETNIGTEFKIVTNTDAEEVYLRVKPLVYLFIPDVESNKIYLFDYEKIEKILPVFWKKGKKENMTFDYSVRMLFSVDGNSWYGMKEGNWDLKFSKPLISMDANDPSLISSVHANGINANELELISGDKWDEFFAINGYNDKPKQLYVLFTMEKISFKEGVYFRGIEIIGKSYHKWKNVTHTIDIVEKQSEIVFSFTENGRYKITVIQEGD